jgi:hypothetical protein
MAGEKSVFKSANKIVEDGSAQTAPTELYLTEYLNSIDLPALPPHLLKLNVGAPVNLLRNLNPAAGFKCNGMRM